MATTIADAYLHELESWKEAIHYYLEEGDSLEEELYKILRTDTISDLAENVEHHLDKLKGCQQKLEDLNHEIVLFESKLYDHQTPIRNTAWTSDFASLHRTLRSKMQTAELEYLKAKYDCAGFQLDTITRQNQQAGNHQL